MTCHHDYTMAHKRKKEAAVCYAANQLAHRYGFGCESDGRNLLDDHVATFLGSTRRGWTPPTIKRARPLRRRASKILN